MKVSALSAIVVFGACSSTVQPSPVASITISGTALFSAVGQTSQLSAVATAPDGTRTNVTDHASWRSSNTAVATISTTGLVTADGFGQADISATYQGISAHVAVFVTPPTPQS